jgi:ABC-2 type transport system ATP-binding protein
LAEVESVCEDVVILSAGQVVASGRVTEVIGQAQRLVIQRRTIRLQVPIPSVPDARRALEVVPDVARVVPTEEASGCLQLELNESANSNGREGRQVNNTILDALIRAEIPILRFEAEGGRLQEAFLHLTEQGHA